MQPLVVVVLHKARDRVLEFPRATIHLHRHDVYRTRFLGHSFVLRGRA